jgi:hypothetical protein
MLVVAMAVTPTSLAMPIAIDPVAVLVSIAVLVAIAAAVRRNNACR